MDCLPQEILKIIIREVAHWDDYASRADLKNLRLTCTRLSKSAALYLFETLPLWLGMSSLMNLVQASEHPYISTLVTGIAFSPLTLSYIFDMTKRDVKDDTRKRLEKELRTMNEFDVYYHRYMNGWKTYALEYEQLFGDADNPRVEIILVRAFRGFQNLQSVELDTEGDVLGAAEAKRVLGRLSGEEFSRSSLDPLKHLIEGLARADKKLARFRMGTAQSRSNARSDDRRTKELKQCYGYLRPPSFKFTNECMDPDALEYAMRRVYGAKKVFQHLKIFEVDGITFDSNGDDDQKERFSMGVEAVVNAAPGLETLVITNLQDGCSPFFEDLDLFERALPIRFSCTQLKYLHCDESCLGDTRLTLLVQSSAETLEHVRLFKFYLGSFGWKWTMDCFRRDSYPRLKTFMIKAPGNTWGGDIGPSEQDIAPYVKGLTDVPPLLGPEELRPMRLDTERVKDRESHHPVDDDQLLALAGDDSD